MLPLVLLVGVVHSIWRLVGIVCRHGDLGEQSLVSKMTFAFRFAVFRFFLAGHPLAPWPLGPNLARTDSGLCGGGKTTRLYIRH